LPGDRNLPAVSREELDARAARRRDRPAHRPDPARREQDEPTSAGTARRIGAAAMIKTLSPRELEASLPTFIELLQETINGGGALGFHAPLAAEDARAYWRALRSELESGSRVLLAAWQNGRIVGSGQLALAPWENATHRATIEKLFVSADMRGRGLGKALI